MKRFSLFLTTFFMGVSFAGAAVISINYSRSTNSPTPLAPTDVAGVEAVDNWNNVQSDSQAGTTTTPSLVDDAGLVTTTQVVSFNRFWRDGVSTATPDATMNSGYTNTSNTADDTISVSGLGTAFTSNGYDVIVYLGGSDGMGLNTPAEFGANVGGAQEQWIRAIRRNPAWSAYNSDTFATEALAQASSTESNYIRFTGLSAASFDLNILKDPDSTANWSRAAVKGIQIVAIPEPSGVILAGFGLVGFLLRRRRK